MAKPQRGPVSVQMGRAMREFRKRNKNTSGSVVAAEARELGDLNWSPATVSKIESGRRALTVEEFLLIPAILHAATGRRTSLRELLSPELTRLPRIVFKNAEIQDGEAKPKDGYEPLAVRNARAIFEEFAEIDALDSGEEE